jgi:hypothetical protein
MQEHLQLAANEECAMSLMCTRGTKGRFKAFGVEFEIIDTTEDSSMLKLRGRRETVVVKDSELRELADQVDRFSAME